MKRFRYKPFFLATLIAVATSAVYVQAFGQPADDTYASLEATLNKAKEILASDAKRNDTINDDTDARPNTDATPTESNSTQPLPQNAQVVATQQYSVPMPPRNGYYSPTRPISLNFNNIDTRQLLKILAEFNNQNFLISDNVKGQMSIHLTSVPWNTALDSVLAAQGLGKTTVGNVTLVAPFKELADNRINQLQADSSVKKLEPLFNLIIPLKYANPDEIAKLITTDKGTLLSERGSVHIDGRTNSVLVRDTQANAMSVLNVVRQLDHPVKQILIEARIVELQKPFESEFGARFGLTNPNSLSGTLEGANQLANGTTPGAITPFTQRLNFDMRAAPSFSAFQSGSIALALAKIGNTYLDMELSAMERDGHIELISSPRLVTSNQNKAIIKTGEEIPYQAATSSGATSVEYKDAVLSLEVTPQITADRRIELALKVTNNRAGDPVPLGATGDAIPIITEEEDSRILVDDHQTIVLGGVYTRDKRNIVVRIPFFGALPVVGQLFRNTQKRDDRSELLIFITPSIIDAPSELT